MSFVAHAQAHGLIINHAIPDGRWHRVPTVDKPRKRNGAYIFECPRCGHCCKSDLARVGEVGVWGEWQGLTDEEHDSIKRNYHNMTWNLS